jgi:thiamine-phosphate pyrophosphorylase
VNAGNAADAVVAGADGVAVVSSIFAATNITAAARDISAAVAAALVAKS